jgi:hypothetical protein
MAEVMPINFPLPSESAVASYNWSDVASGETYITFYPFFANPLYCMSATPINSGLGPSISQFGYNTTLTFTTTAFNAPRTIKGLAIASCPWIKSDANNKTVTVTIKKVTAEAVESTLCTITLNTITGREGAGVAGGSATIAETIIGVGEYLRAVFVIPSDCYISFDPVDRSWRYWVGSDWATNTYGATRIEIPVKVPL